jgi:hypothetical protein
MRTGLTRFHLFKLQFPIEGLTGFSGELRNVTVGRSQPTPPRREPWHEPNIAFSPAHHL